MQTSAELDVAEAPLCTGSDRELISRFLAARDEEAFAEIVTRYRRLVMRVAQSTLRDWHAAEDAFQATFLVLARSARRIQKRDSLAAWLHGTTYRVSQRLRRTRLRTKEQELAAIELASPERGTSSISDQLSALDQELSRLRDGLRDPLLLYYFEGHTINEIARKLRITPATAKGRLSRGKQKLRKRLLKRGILFSSAVYKGSQLNVAEAQVAPSVIEATVAACVSAAASSFLTPIAATTVASLALQEIAVMTRLALLKTSLMWAGIAGVVGLSYAGMDGVEGRALAKAPHNPAKIASPPPVTDQSRLPPRSVITAVAQLPAQAPASGAPRGNTGVQAGSPSGARPGTSEKSAVTEQKQLPPYRIVSRPRLPGDQRIYDALDRKVDWQFTGQTLREVMNFLATQENITIEVDAEALKEAGVPIDAEINLIMSGSTLRTGLDRMLSKVDGVALDYVIDNEVMTITTRKNADLFMEPRIYDLRGVASTTPEQLARILETTVAPASWKGQGGTGFATPLEGSVLVNQSQRNHWEIAALMEMLNQQSKLDLYPTGPYKSARAMDAPAIDPRRYALTGRPKPSNDGRPQVVDFRQVSDAESRIQEVLTKDVDLQFNRIKLQDAFKSLAEQHGINVKLDGPALKDAKVPLDTEINLVASGLSLANGLALMLKNVAGKRLEYMIEDEMLVVTTAERANAMRETRIYDVQGITGDPQQLVPLLSRWCGPDDAKAAAGALVVTASQPVHREVLPFLEQLTEFRQIRAAAEDRARAAKPAAPMLQNQ